MSTFNQLKLSVITALVALLPAVSLAQSESPLRFIYEEPMEGVYSQGWFAQELGQTDESVFEVYVVGQGKAGDFYGVISVNCLNPQFSAWLATGGWVSANDVPAQAIRSIRNLACDMRRP